MSIFFTSKEALLHTDVCGPKAVNLAKLEGQGFLIPPFVVLPSNAMIAFSTMSPEEKAKVYTQCIQLLNCEHFAVRSASLTEDASKDSQAGMFRTELNVMHGDLIEMMIDVIADAETKLESLEQFSLIIQQYIEPDFSGVTFTRNPLNGREMVVEYAEGLGENIVNGSIQPNSVSLYWNQNIPTVAIPNFATGVQVCKKIEQYFEFPQDIEWCIQNKKWYIVQSRPITSLTESKYKKLLYIDSNAPQGHNFLEKTELCDIAPTPTPFTLSLLKKIYAKRGPVQRAYKTFGVEYRTKDFVRILGNELLIDKEKELQTIYPAYVYTENKTPSMCKIGGFMRTIRNMSALKSMEPRVYVQHTHTALHDALHTKEQTTSFSDAIEEFMQTYKIIVEANILATQALYLAENALPEHVSILESISDPSLESLPEILPPESSCEWVGNTLEISDESNFYHTRSSSNSHNSIVLPEHVRTRLSEAKQAAQLREYGRWLTVKLSNMLRKSIATFDVPKELTAFVTIDEYMQNIPNIEIIRERKTTYEQMQSEHFDPILYGTFQTHVQTLSGVSPGQAIGTLVTEEMIGNTQGPTILWNSTLAPYLTKHLDSVVGVISETGGLLSHFAIVARENNVPVITGVNLAAQEIEIGMHIRINGTNGTIEKVL